MEEQLSYCFTIYDLNDDGYISKGLFVNIDGRAV